MDTEMQSSVMRRLNEIKCELETLGPRPHGLDMSVPQKEWEAHANRLRQLRQEAQATALVLIPDAVADELREIISLSFGVKPAPDEAKS